MAQQSGDDEAVDAETESATTLGRRTARDPATVAAAGSVLLSWFQYYVRGNKQHGLFIGLWAPTLLAFSNSVRISNLSRKVADGAADMVDRMTENR